MFGESLFAVTAAQGISWALNATDATVVAIEPRYLPSALHWIVAVPGLRELVTWNLLIVLRRSGHRGADRP